MAHRHYAPPPRVIYRPAPVYQPPVVIYRPAPALECHWNDGRVTPGACPAWAERRPVYDNGGIFSHNYVTTWRP